MQQTVEPRVPMAVTISAGLFAIGCRLCLDGAL